MRARPPRIVLLGVMSKVPIGGMIWQTLHYLLGFERLGYEVHYVEAHATPPKMFADGSSDRSDRSDRAAAFIDRTLREFGFRGRWAYQALHHDGRCHGMGVRELHALLESATLLVNLHGSTVLCPEHRTAERIVYLETDPTELQIELTRRPPETHEFLEAHDAFFTFGENYGNADCGLPVSDRFLFRPTRQPVLVDMWQEAGELPRAPYTTVGNWRQPWREGVRWDDDHYTWSKHHEFAKILDLPAKTHASFELALGHLADRDRKLLIQHGWGVRDALEVSRDHRVYRAFIGASRGEFTVAKDQNVRLRSGWFSDRSATYLAAGRPVVTQDTGFGNVLPTGEGLFAFRTADDVLAAVEAIESDPAEHSRAAREIAREYFAHDVVLGRLLADLGISPPAAPLGVCFARRPGLPPTLPIVPRSRRPTTLAPLTEAEMLSAPLPAPTPGPSPCRPRRSVVMVTHSELPFTRMAIESVLANTAEGSFELVVVDNASTDDTVDHLRGLAERYPCIRLVLNDENRGFAAASNQGLKAAVGAVLVLLNNDTIVTPGWLDVLERHLADPAVGLVGPVTNGAPNEARIDTDYRTYGQMVGLARERAGTMEGRGFDIPVLTMFCTAMRRDVYDDVGPLDEAYGRGLLEDDDYSIRVRGTGRRVVCAEDAFVHHFGQASFGKLVTTGEYGKLLAANRARFEAKWGTTWRAHVSRPSQSYDRLRDDVRRLVEGAVPSGGVVLVISRGDPELLRLDDRSAWHFPRGDGGYAGHYPARSDEAIRHLEELHALGAGYLLVPTPSLWWLDHYEGFAAHLRERCEEIARDESGIVFGLGAPPDPGEPTVACCVAGMHRSGTSMVAGALAAAGMRLGDADDLFGGSEDNPDGYWEHRRFVALNERILDALGGAWDCPPSAPDRWWRAPEIRALREDADALTAEFPYAGCWGWKDPRNSLTLPFWLDVVPQLRVVICLRDPSAVAESLKRRAMLSARLSLRLWHTYNARALAAAPADAVLVVDYDRMLRDPASELRRLLGFLSLDPGEHKLDAAMESVSPRRRRSGTSANLQASGDVEELHRHMRALAGAAPSQACPA